MNWEQKLQALQALCDTSLRMRKPGDWYVSAVGREVSSDDSCILASPYGNGLTSQAAVEDDWRKLTECLLPNQYIVLNAGKSNRKHVRWNGFMWQDLVVQP